MGQGYLEGNLEDILAEAKSMIKKSLELDENDFECHRLLCEINKFFKDFEQAEYYGRKGFEMNPNDPRIVSAYGDLLVLTGRAGEGTDLLIKAYELDPVGMGASNADSRLGDVMFGAYMKGDYEQCLEYDKKTGKKKPLAWAAKIASQQSLNQFKEKEVELKKFADVYPQIVLDDEIDKIHIQDASAKQTLKDLVA